MAVSEPCLSTEYYPYRRHICLELKINTEVVDADGLKSYDNNPGEFEDDEFFLIQYPTRESLQGDNKSKSEPNVLENYDVPHHTPIRRCLNEYYNDFAECFQTCNRITDRTVKENIEVRVEMSDDEIFNEIFLPFKSQSTPDITDGSFVMLTYDPGPDLNRRKSTAEQGYKVNDW